MKKILLGIVVIGILGSCTGFEDYKKDFESDTKGLNRIAYIYSRDGKLLKSYESENMRLESKDDGRVSLLVNKKRILVQNAIIVIEEK